MLSLQVCGLSNSHLPSLHRAFGSIGSIGAYNSLPSSHPPFLFFSFSLCFLYHLYPSLPTHGSLPSLFLVPHAFLSASCSCGGYHSAYLPAHRPSAAAHSENLRLSVVSMYMCTRGRQSLSFAGKHFGANSSILGVGSYLENSRSSCSSPAFHLKLGKNKKVSSVC